MLEDTYHFIMETQNGQVKDVGLYVRVMSLEDGIQIFVLMQLTA